MRNPFRPDTKIIQGPSWRDSSRPAANRATLELPKYDMSAASQSGADDCFDTFDEVRLMIGDLAPELARAVEDAVYQNKTAYAMNLLCALSVSNFSAQGAYDIVSPRSSVIPLATYTMIPGRSGVGKTHTSDYFLSQIREFEDKYNAVIADQLAAYKRKMREWTATLAGLENALRKKSEKGGDLSEAKAKLDEHGRDEPVSPKNATFLANNVTRNALVELLSAQGSAFVATGECAALFSGQLMREASIADLNTAWDGGLLDSLSMDRNTRVASPRLSILALGQEEAFRKLENRKGTNPNAIGFFPRCLIYHVKESPSPQRDVRAKALMDRGVVFRDRISENLRETMLVRDGKRERGRLKLTADAEAYWDDLSVSVAELGKHEDWKDAEKYLSKVAVNALRIAAGIHLIERRDGDVGLGTLGLAAHICYASAQEYMAFFCGSSTDIGKEKALLERIRFFYACGARYQAYEYYTRFGPAGTRSKAALEMALNSLQAKGLIAANLDGKPKVIDANPGAFYGAHDRIWGQHELADLWRTKGVR